MSGDKEETYDALLRLLAEMGWQAYAVRLDKAVAGAATGTELHMGLRGVLLDLLKEQACVGECRRLAEKLLGSIDSALRK